MWTETRGSRCSSCSKFKTAPSLRLKRISTPATVMTIMPLRQQLERLLTRDAVGLPKHLQPGTEAFRKRMDEYYLPMVEWVQRLLEKPKSDAAPGCLCVGVSCVQGGGKTTVTKYIEELLTLSGKTCAVVSLDDVYWDHSTQLALAAANPGNPLLEVKIWSTECMDNRSRTGLIAALVVSR